MIGKTGRKLPSKIFLGFIRQARLDPPVCVAFYSSINWEYYDSGEILHPLQESSLKKKKRKEKKKKKKIVCTGQLEPRRSIFSWCTFFCFVHLVLLASASKNIPTSLLLWIFKISSFCFNCKYLISLSLSLSLFFFFLSSID